MSSFVARPIADRLEGQPSPTRLFVSDGALLTQDHFRDEQLYLRGLLARLALFATGHGTLAGFNVTYDPPAGGLDVEVKVDPGLAIDRLGRLIEVPYASCLRLTDWVARVSTTDEGRAELQAGLRAAAGPLPDRVVADVYLRFKACARTPEPAFATLNADTIDSVQPSRVLDAGVLDLVVRPDGDDRAPSSLAAANLADPVSIDRLQQFKREDAFRLTRAEQEPFALPAGPPLSEHIVAGNRQDGSEVHLARLAIPIDASDPAAMVFDTTVPLPDPDQSLRPYAYGAAELALLSGIRR